MRSVVGYLATCAWMLAACFQVDDRRAAGCVALAALSLFAAIVGRRSKS